MIDSLKAQLEILSNRKENTFGHLVRLKEANIDFLAVEDMVPVFLPFNSLFVDINFSKFEMELVYPKMKVLKNLLDDVSLTNVSRKTRVFRPRVRIMTQKDLQFLRSMNKFREVDIQKLKRATVRNYFHYLRNSIKLQRLMLKRKHTYENALKIILNDEYKENIILMHYDYSEDASTLTSSRLIETPKQKLPSTNSIPNSTDISSMKRIQNKRNIFDEESIELEGPPQPKVSSKSLGQPKSSQRIKKKGTSRREVQRPKKEDDSDKKLKNLIQTCKRIHFHMKVQVGLCVKFITKKFKLEDELKIGPIVIDIFQPIKQVV